MKVDVFRIYETNLHKYVFMKLYYLKILKLVSNTRDWFQLSSRILLFFDILTRYVPFIKEKCLHIISIFRSTTLIKS